MTTANQNWNLIGHEWAVQLLRGQLARGELRHAYLFTGPAGVGRRTLALALAQALACSHPNRDPATPCQTCRDCLQMAHQTHPDLTIVQAEEPGGTLKVDQMRALQRSLNLTPYQARYRVALLLRFEEAHPSAANALLKTLEEPPPQVKLLLTAEDVDALPPTVVSRCEVLRLRPLPPDQLAASMAERWGANPAEARLLASLSNGLPGRAYDLLRHPDVLNERQAWLDEHLQLLHANRAARFAYAEKIARDKPALRRALVVWLSFWRDVFRQQAGSPAPFSNLDRAEDIQRLASRLSGTAGRESLLALDQALQRIDHNVNPRLAVEALFLHLPYLGT